MPPRRHAPGEMHTHDVLPAALDAYLEAARSLDEERWLGTLSPDVVSGIGSDGVPRAGREPLRELLRGTLVSYPDLTLEENGTLLAGRVAAIRWTMHAHGPDGRALAIPAIDIVQFDDEGRVRYRWLHIGDPERSLAST